MDIDEKIDFLQNEYEWNRHRKERISDGGTTMFGWNIAVFGFVFAFTNIEKIVDVINAMYINIKLQKVCIVIILLLILIMIIGLVICCISFVKLFKLEDIGKINNFDIGDLNSKNFDKNEIVKDYIKILDDYDRVCDEIAKEIMCSKNLLTKGGILIFVSEILLKIFITIVMKILIII